MLAASPSVSPTSWRVAILSSSCFPSYIVNKAVGTLVKPDAYIFFRIPVEESMRRQDSREELRTGSVDVLGNCEKFYKAFFSILEPEVPLYEIDAARPMDAVVEEVMGVLVTLLGSQLSSF